MVFSPTWSLSNVKLVISPSRDNERTLQTTAATYFAKKGFSVQRKYAYILADTTG